MRSCLVLLSLSITLLVMRLRSLGMLVVFVRCLSVFRSICTNRGALREWGRMVAGRVFGEIGGGGTCDGGVFLDSIFV